MEATDRYNVYDYSNEQPYYANLGDGGRENLWAGAWSSQFGGDGLHAPFYPVSEAELQNSAAVPGIVRMRPALIGQGPERQPGTQAFVATHRDSGGTGRVGDFLAKMIPPARNSVADYWSPQAPQRKDPYNQSYQLSSGQYYAGTSPQRGIYTGVEDM